MARRPAAEPRIRLLTIFMLNLQVALGGIAVPRTPSFIKTAQPLRAFGHTRMNARTKANHLQRDDGEPPSVESDYACGNYLIKIVIY